MTARSLPFSRVPWGKNLRIGTSELDYAYLVRAIDRAIHLSDLDRWTPLDDQEAQRLELYLARHGVFWNPYAETYTNPQEDALSRRQRLGDSYPAAYLVPRALPEDLTSPASIHWRNRRSVLV